MARSRMYESPGLWQSPQLSKDHQFFYESLELFGGMQSPYPDQRRALTPTPLRSGDKRKRSKVLDDTYLLPRQMEPTAGSSSRSDEMPVTPTPPEKRLKSSKEDGAFGEFATPRKSSEESPYPLKTPERGTGMFSEWSASPIFGNFFSPSTMPSLGTPLQIYSALPGHSSLGDSPLVFFFFFLFYLFLFTKN